MLLGSHLIPLLSLVCSSVIWGLVGVPWWFSGLRIGTATAVVQAPWAKIPHASATAKIKGIH